MKKTIYMLPALALMLFAACSSEDAVTKESPAQLNETPENAIGFGAYLNRSVTRAGYGGALELAELQSEGFGVFAYYGDGDLYSENLLPNFMYNQQVEWGTSGPWSYTPIKYWPNEFGQSAVSTGVDRVSFFAYAPYVAVTPATGQPTNGQDETTGITALTRNGKAGDPYVKYVGIYDPTKCVDLCYGVAAENYTSSVGAGDGTNDIKEGDPFLNVAKPTTSSPLKFKFKHALAKLKVTVDADINTISHGNGVELNEKDAMTRVWIRSITFNGIAPKGYLNLHSGYWYDAVDNDKISLGSVTIYDGRRDGLEATASDSYEYPTGLNGDLVQSVAYSTTTSGIQYNAISTPTEDMGVTKAEQNLFSNTDNDATILVIPANEQLKVTIVYDVETADATLPTYLSDGTTKGSTVENKITKYITIGGNPLKLLAGNSYELALHLGLNTVEFNAEMGGWDTPADIDEPWLPSNMLTVAKGETREINVPSDAIANYYFKVTGLTPGATVTVSRTKGTGGNTFDPALTDSKVPASGEVTVKISTISENTSTTDTVENTFVVKEGDSTAATVNIIQAKKTS